MKLAAQFRFVLGRVVSEQGDNPAAVLLIDEQASPIIWMQLAIGLDDRGHVARVP